MAGTDFSQLRRIMQRLIAMAAVGLFVSGCASARYYVHVAHGEARLLLERRPVGKVLEDPATSSALAARLRLSQQARRFASRSLDLPDNRSYTSYVQLQRPYVAWNVFAAPRYSVEAVPQCFPIAGCVAYRGYFSETMAQAAAQKLKDGGDDVWVGGVPAYSTLGWFADPILSSMLRWDDDELAGTIFHELAHQLIYVKGDTAFNESFATFVEQQGLREWRRSRSLPAQDTQAQAMDDGFTALVLALRKQLAQGYARGGTPAEREAAKQADIEEFRRHYRQWRDAQWPNQHRYDAWVAAPINNARLLPFGLYDQWTPAFEVVFEQAGHRWRGFYNRVRALAKLPVGPRRLALDGLLRPVARPAP
jgi:predicted aminopeptidase